MQKYWTLLKLVLLAGVLFVMLWLERGPGYMTVRLRAADDGTLRSMEIDGVLIDRPLELDSGVQTEVEQWLRHRIDTWQYSPNPSLRFQIDDDLIWKDARLGIEIFLGFERKPEITIVDDLADPSESETFVVLRPGQPDGSNVEFVYLVGKADLPDVAIGGQGRILGQGAAGFDRLNQEILKIIGEPGSDRARSLRTEIHVRGRNEFRDVRALLKAVSGKRDAKTGEWIPYGNSIRFDSLLSPDERFGNVRDALTMITPQESSLGRGVTP